MGRLLLPSRGDHDAFLAQNKHPLRRHGFSEECKFAKKVMIKPLLPIAIPIKNDLPDCLKNISPHPTGRARQVNIEFVIDWYAIS